MKRLLTLLITLTTTLGGVAHGQTVQQDLAEINAPPPAFPPGTSLPATPTSLNVSLSARALQVLQPPGSGGVALREVPGPSKDGHASARGAGSPDLALRMVDVIVPWDADLTTLDIDVHTFNTAPAGTFTVHPVGLSGTTDPQTLLDAPVPGEADTFDAAGRDPAIYNTSAPWPTTPLRVESAGSLRRYRYVRLAFAPYRWNPVTRQLQKVVNLGFTLSWERQSINPNKIRTQLADPVDLPERALGRFINWEGIGPWYHLPNGFVFPFRYKYIIITTDAVKSGLTQLTAFKTHKASRGLPTYAMSVEAIDAAYTGSERADRIRAFLQDKVSTWGIEYVLMVGDPDPYDIYDLETGTDIGNVPMKMAWPRGDGLESKGDGEACPTDHYYGDLSRDWDVDGDGYAAAWDDDFTPINIHIDLPAPLPDLVLDFDWYGVDWDMEVAVGRLQAEDTTQIDDVLTGIMDYEDRDLGLDPDPERANAWLPTGRFASDTDYGHLAEQIMTDSSVSAALTWTTMYESASTLTPDLTLATDTLADEWALGGAGMVIWAGHGNHTAAYVLGSGHFMSSSDVPSADLDPGAFVYEGSCQNAWPEDSANLAWTLVKYGAMATVAGTRNSWYTHGQTRFGSNNTIGDIGYWMAMGYSAGTPAGDSLAVTRQNLDPFNGRTWMQNALTYNLTGDPSVAYTF